MESELENAKHHIKCLEQELNEKEEKSATKSSKIIEYEDFVPPELWTNNKV